MLILELAEGHVDTGGEEPDEHVQVEEEGGPSGRLVLGNGSDDGDVDLGVARVPEGVEASAPWSNGTGDGQEDKAAKANDEDEQDEGAKQGLELPAWHLSTDPFDKSNNLEEAKDTCSDGRIGVRDCRVTRVLGREMNVPSAAMWSLLLMGRKPTKGICMLASVPRAYQVV